jgi:hypothetical protein
MLRGHCVGFGRLIKEIFHFAGWRETDQDPAGLVADICPHMGDASRSQNGIAGRQGESMISHLDNERPFERIEPLVLFEVQMAGRSTLGEHGLLNEKEATAGVSGAHLEVESRYTKAALGFEAIVSARDEERDGW